MCVAPAFIDAFAELENFFDMPIDRTEHLENALKTHRMSHIDALVSKYKSKRNEIKDAIKERYSGRVYDPIDSGSFKKHTAINHKFDFDVLAPYKRNSFDTLEQMFDDVYDFLVEKYAEDAAVRKQKVSIGIRFHPDEDNEIISIDVTPGRELNQDEYSDDKRVKLSVDSKYGLIQGKSNIQTNLHAQIDHIKTKDDARKIIRLLKIWKYHNNENYKSFFFELVVIKAFEKVDVTGNLWEKLKIVMEYIKDNVSVDGFTLLDPGNSNNDVIDTLESWERSLLSTKMETIIARIEDNGENIRTYFPVNQQFVEEESERATYGVKSSGILYSVPPSTRFG